MRNAVEEFFLAPEGTIEINVQDSLAEDPDWFCFGAGLAGYGRCRIGCGGGAGPESSDLLHDVEHCGTTLLLPFDPAEVAENLRNERYLHPDMQGSRADWIHKVYYTLRPFLPVAVRKHAQRRALLRRDVSGFPAWPIDRTVERIFERILALALKKGPRKAVPFIWFWPEGKSSCILMTHDVEEESGLCFCDTLMRRDDEYDIPASFQLIPGARYRAGVSKVSELRRRGFEVNIHDWTHDGLLYSNYKVFLERARKINACAASWRAEGFRSGALYRNTDWYEALTVSYDMSIPASGRMDAQAGGCCTTLPWFIGPILEIPVTMTQDYTLFHILNEYSTELWEQELAELVDAHGLASFIVHPDYVRERRAWRVYRQLLEHICRLRSESNVWVTFPGEVNEWWRARSRMHLVARDYGWEIRGEGSERAQIAWAQLEGDQIVYTFGSPKLPGIVDAVTERQEHPGTAA